MWARPIGDGLQPYDETFSYDRNGNILSLQRTAASSAGVLTTDVLGYNYTTDNNRLNSLTESASPPTSMGDVGNTSYTYDSIGNLTTELATDENYKLRIAWTPYGKVDTVARHDASGTLIDYHTYLYDAMGNQVRDYKWAPTHTLTEENFHIYDGHNTMLARYYTPSISYTGVSHMHVAQRYLYGSERLGTIRGSNAISSSITHPTILGFSFDEQYELHDHLGNVRATLSSIPPTVTSGGITSVQTMLYNHYYAFGSPHPNRSYEPPGSYAWGFNGQERKDDYKGIGNHNHALYWEYDTRMGRRWNTDPRPIVGISGYSTFNNAPIWTSDHNGDTTFRFNLLGMFLGAYDLAKKGIQGSIGSFVYDRESEKWKWEGTDFEFNDPDVDRKQLLQAKPGKKMLQIVEDAEINGIAVKNGIEHRSFFSRFSFAATQHGRPLRSGIDRFDKRVGGKMDFGIQIFGGLPGGKEADHSGGFFLFGSDRTRAFNAMDAGNWMWGRAMQILGFSKFSVHFGSQMNEGFGDTKSDQDAIGRGFRYKVKTNLKKVFKLKND